MLNLFKLINILSTYLNRALIVRKMSVRKDFLTLGAAVASAVAGYMALNYNKQKLGSKSNGIEDVLKDENNTTNGLQPESLNDKDKLKRDRDEEEFKAFALFWNSWK